MNNYLLHELNLDYEFLNVIYSLILLTGLYQLGSLILKIRVLRNIFIEISDLKYLNIFISTNLILLIFYPLILFSNKINFIPFLSIGIFSFGIFKIFSKFKSNLYFKKLTYEKNSLDKYLVFVTLILLVLLSLSPNTHGDSLGYHFVVAKKLLISGKYHFDITHFHSLLAGSGEILIAIGLFFGSEHFGSLVQFSGLISILGIIKKIKDDNKFYYLLLILTSPVIIFLSSTAKPQLFHICSSSVIFCLYLFTNSKSLNLTEKNWKLIVSILVLIVSVSAKFNFIISSALLGLIILYNSLKDKNFIYFLLSLILCFFIFYFPIIFSKVTNFGGNIFQYFISPLPLNIIGLDEFQNYLVRYGRGYNPIEIIFTTKLNKFTQCIGIAIFYLLIINFKNTKVRITLAITLTYIFVQYFYGQFMGRSFLEPLFWILLISAKYGVINRIKLFEFFCRLQALAVISGIIFGIYSLTPGSLSSKLKSKVLSKNANGFALFEWSNDILKKEDVAFSLHRSISLGTSEFISTDFIPHVDFTDERSEIFVKAIDKKNPNYLLTWSYTNEPPNLFEFKNCIGKLLYYKKSVGKFEARNPFNRGRKYDGYIFELKKKEFPTCLKK